MANDFDNNAISENMAYVDDLSDDTIETCEEIRAKYIELAEFIENSLFHSRTRALALTNLEQSLMWAIKATVHQDA